MEGNSPSGRSEGGGEPVNALFAEIERQRLKREARAAAIERGEIVLEDPREKREREMKANKRQSIRPR